MSTAPWIIRTKAKPQLRLFCFPYAGGGASIYRNWTNKLPSEIEICPVHLPGREERMREPLFTHISPLIRDLANALHPYLDIPFAFFGHSLGALLSFELARHLRNSKKPVPTHVLVSAHRAPQLPHTDQALHQMPDPQFIKSLHRLGGTPEAVLQHEELMQVVLPILRADFTIYETYIYSKDTPLDCPITAFGGQQDDTVSVQELEGWREQTSREFELYMLPGKHFFLQENQDLLLQRIARILTQLIEKQG